jgi:hypothetical protein
MKSVLKFSALVLAYLLFGARSCDNEERYTANREQKETNQVIDSIGAVFGADKLSPATLQAYEHTALLKLSDLLDYSIIAADTSVASVFRDRATQMIRSSFVSGNCVIRSSTNGKPGMQNISVEQLSRGKAFSSEFLNQLKYDSVWISEGLHPVSDSTYSGQLSFSLPGKNFSAKEFKPSSATQFEFFAVKREKQFGNKTLKIWTVLLGNGSISSDEGRKPK